MRQTSALPEEPEVNCKMGRTWKGPHESIQRDFPYSNLQRDYDPEAGITIVVETLVVCIDEGAEPTDEDIIQVHKLLMTRIDAAVKAGGRAHNLSSHYAATLGHTTDALSMDGAQGIAAKLKATGKASLGDMFD